MSYIKYYYIIPAGKATQYISQSPNRDYATYFSPVQSIISWNFAQICFYGIAPGITPASLHPMDRPRQTLYISILSNFFQSRRFVNDVRLGDKLFYFDISPRSLQMSPPLCTGSDNIWSRNSIFSINDETNKLCSWRKATHLSITTATTLIIPCLIS